MTQEAVNGAEFYNFDVLGDTAPTAIMDVQFALLRNVFGAYPYVGDFMSTVPVAWDDTRLIQGDIDDHVILARRRGSDWYLAGIHAAEAPIEYTFALDFLDGGSYELALIEQGEADDSFERTVQSVESGDSAAITLPANGGFVAMLTPE